MPSQNNTLISVIMPCFNDGAYLEEAVESLRRQTRKDLELIIIDDGSDDPETLKVIQEVSFPQKTVLNTRHIGPAAARNRGIEAARGAYILPLDADDTIEPTYIGKAAEVLSTRPEVGVVYCHADLFGEKDGPWDLPDYNLEAELLDNVIFVTAMFRREDWKAIGGFSEDFHAGMEDYDFWLSMLQSGKEVHQLPETLFHYRIKPASRTTKFQRSYADVQGTYVKLYQRHRELYQKHMDLYCMVLRRNLIDQLMINKRLSGMVSENNDDRELVLEDWVKMLIASDQKDPLLEYVASIRRMKPGLARFLERLLSLKNRIKGIFGRK